MDNTRQPLSPLSDAVLKRELRELGKAIAWPPAPDFAASIRLHLQSQTTPLPHRHSRFAALRHPLAIAALVLLALVASIALLAGLRDAVADMFGVRGIRIVVERAHPTQIPAITRGTTPLPTGQRLLLGDPVSLEEAAQLAGFLPRVPSQERLGAADEIYARRLPDGTVMISLVYLPGQNLPETAETGVGLLLMEFAAKQDTGFIVKSLAGDGILRTVMVNGHQGWWIEGTSQLVMLTDPTSGCCPGVRRPSGNILLWESGGITFRMESALSQEEALAIAAAMAPEPTGD